jgi:hypothetical protein
VPSDTEAMVLEELVRAALVSGKRTLADVLDVVLPQIESAKRYAVIGRIATQVAVEAAVCSSRDRPWVQVPGDVEIEDWALPGGRSHA